MENDKEKFKIELKTRIYKWTLSLMKFIDALPREGSTDIIAAQLMRSGTSIGANYVEAQAASSRKDFTNFIYYALKSANESKFWLALLRDSNKGDKDKISILLNELIELSNILGSSLLTLKGKK